MKTTIANSLGRLLLVVIALLHCALVTGRSATGVVAWGDNSAGQTNVPDGLTNIIQIAAGNWFSLALKADATLVAWGLDSFGEIHVPAGLTNAVAIAAGQFHGLVVTADGNVVGWGNNASGQTDPPADLTDAVAVAAGWNHSLALRSDGTVVRWGGRNGPGGVPVPANLTDVVAIAAGGDGSLALKRDGTVVEWGTPPGPPPELNDVVAIAARGGTRIALKADGTVVTWGGPAAPPGLNNVLAIAASDTFSMALKLDGTVVGWGGQSVPEGLSNVVNIAGGFKHALALVGDGTPLILRGPTSQRVLTGATAVLPVFAIGSLPLTYQWWKEGVSLGKGTNSLLSLSNVRLDDSGAYTVVLSNSFGAVTSGVARLRVVRLGTPEIRADGVTLIENATRLDQSIISMSTSFSNGTVFYTTDGSTPSFASERYQGSIMIAQTITIRAIAYNEDFTQSAEEGPFQIQILRTYTLDRSVAGQGTIRAFPDHARYYSGAIITLRASAASGWRFARWGGDVCGGATDVAVAMDASKTVIAVFEEIPSYVLAASTPGGGTISGDTGSSYFGGTVVSLTAQPGPGWQFLRWQGDADGTSPTLAVTMDRAMNIQAVFGTLLSTTVGGSGSLALNPAQEPYPYGSTVHISARPSVGSFLAVWGSAASGKASSLDFVVTNGNPTISALFAPLQGNEVNVYPNLDGEGRVTAFPNLQPYSPGSSVTLTATPSPGWRFVEWHGDASGTLSPTTVVLNTSKTVTAVFQVLPRYALATTAAGGGFVSGNTGSPYAEGDVVNLTAQPATGWQFLRWQGDASGTTPNVAVAMDRARNVQAVFATTSVLTNVVGPGTVTLDPAQGPYPFGTTVRLTATPNAGSSFAGWGNAASGAENPLDYVVTTATPAICALFAPGENTAPPTITGQPTSQSVILGRNATLHVNAAGASPFAYQWRKDGIPLSGATASTYVIFGATANDGGVFDVVVSNPFGSVTSSLAQVTVVFPPSITVQPTNQLVAAGNAATLFVTAAGTEPLAYQWWTFSGPSMNATNATLVLNPATTNDAGNYVVVVSNPYGAVTSQVAILTVFVPVSITRHPAQQVVSFRGTATFSVQASGYPAPQYQWLFNGAILAGANLSSLVITNVGTNALGGYSVIAWNAYSAATSSVAMLLMSPSIRFPFLGATVIWGKSATLSASALGSGDLSYQWFKDGVAIPFASGPTLVIPTVQLEDAGLYSLVVRSIWGSVTNAPAQVVVNPANISLAMYAGVTIDGVPGYTYGIQYTTDLRDTNTWVNATNLTLAAPVEVWVDLESAGGAKRFYRVIAR